MASATLRAAERSLLLLQPATALELDAVAYAALELLLADEQPAVPACDACGLAEEDAWLATQALAHTFLSAARLAMKPAALKDWLEALGFAADACDGVCGRYEAALPALRAGVEAEALACASDTPSLHALHWRLDVRVRLPLVAGLRLVADLLLRLVADASIAQLASRAAQQEAAPSFLLQFLTGPPGATGEQLHSTWAECDYATLAALSADVDEAVRKSAAASRRVARLLSKQLPQ